MTGFAALAAVAMSANAEVVSFPSLDATPIQAHVFQPVRQPPRGTVVALHGCGGLYATTGSRKGEFSARHRGYAEMLTGDGYAVVYPDSHHGFDSPVGRVRLLKEVPNGANPGQGVHSGRNAEAARQSGALVRDLLREAFR